MHALQHVLLDAKSLHVSGCQLMDLAALAQLAEGVGAVTVSKHVAIVTEMPILCYNQYCAAGVLILNWLPNSVAAFASMLSLHDSLLITNMNG